MCLVIWPYLFVWALIDHFARKVYTVQHLLFECNQICRHHYRNTQGSDALRCTDCSVVFPPRETASRTATSFSDEELQHHDAKWEGRSCFTARKWKSFCAKLIEANHALDLWLVGKGHMTYDVAVATKHVIPIKKNRWRLITAMFLLIERCVCARWKRVQTQRKVNYVLAAYLEIIIS